jgi:glycolate oxidase FAD binding subunit
VQGAGDVLDTTGLRGVELYEPGALTLVVRAGTGLAEVQALLAGERQRLSFEVPDLRAILGREGNSTIGGVVAANASGPRRVQSGACRDSLLGVRFVDGAGTVVKNGGRVMKNVTGYDLVKLMAGSQGRLGVLTEVSLRVQALPEAETTLFGPRTAEAGLAALRGALGSPFDISGAAFAQGQALIRVEGMVGSVAYRAGFGPGWAVIGARSRALRVPRFGPVFGMWHRCRGARGRSGGWSSSRPRRWALCRGWAVRRFTTGAVGWSGWCCPAGRRMPCVRPWRGRAMPR